MNAIDRAAPRCESQARNLRPVPCGIGHDFAYDESFSVASSRSEIANLEKTKDDSQNRRFMTPEADCNIWAFGDRSQERSDDRRFHTLARLD